MALRISVFSSKELQATILALKGMDRAVSKYVRGETKRAALPIWQESVRANVTGRQEDRVLGVTARVAVSNQNVTLQSAQSVKRLSGGATVADLSHHVEFGADQNFTKTYPARSRKGRTYTVTNRHTRRQFRARNLKGYSVYPAAAAAIPRLASLWVQTTIRAFYEVLEGKE